MYFLYDIALLLVACTKDIVMCDVNKGVSF